MSGIVLYDDARARTFEPFALTRPISELRAGAEIIRRRWERAMGASASGFASSPHLAMFEELDAPSAATSIPVGTIVASSRFAPALTDAPRDTNVWTCGGRIAAMRVPAADIASLESGDWTFEMLAGPNMRTASIDGWWLDDIWDVIRHLQPMLVSDIAAIASTLERAVPTGLTTIGAHDVVIERGAEIEPMVVFDASAGPILVRRGAHISAFSKLVGPCVIGEHAIVAGGKIAGSSIGEYCRVHGELSTSVFIGHANKAHDGFVGHSILGRWVNLGASTVTSNLKNTYGSVALWTPDGQRDTGLQFLGTMFGDHVKTAIGSRLNTGSVLGAGANVFGSGMTPKVVAPFAWGTDRADASYELDRFLVVAERAMARRHVTLSDAQRTMLARAFERRWSVGA